MKNKDSKKVKVLIVAASMRFVGGQSVQAKRLVDAFENDPEIEMSFLPNDPPAPFQNVRFLRTILTSLKFWFLLLRTVPKFDLVQIFSSGTTSYLISTLPPLVVSKLFGKKNILNYHNGALEEHLENWKLSARPTMRKFDEIVVPSQFLVDVFAKYELPATAVFNFVNGENFKFRERKIFRPVFLSNRNFEAHYNVADVLRAFQVIQNRFPEAALLIAGFGMEESALKRLTEELKLKNVEFTGKLSNDEMAGLYDRADIYLNTSVVDNMPLSFIEAFSCGLPVVSYATGGIPYLVENDQTGLLVEPGDFDELAQKAVFLLEKQEIAKKIAARAQAEAVKYSWENIRRDWVQIYLRTVGD